MRPNPLRAHEVPMLADDFQVEHLGRTLGFALYAEYLGVAVAGLQGLARNELGGGHPVVAVRRVEPMVRRDAQGGAVAQIDLDDVATRMADEARRWAA